MVVYKDCHVKRHACIAMTSYNVVYTCLIINGNTPLLASSLAISPSLVSQTHFCKREKGLVNCEYKLCPAVLYSVVQSYCGILSHDTLHHLSSNSSLKTAKESKDIFPATAETVKTL